MKRFISIPVAPSVDTAIYASGDLIGGKLTIPAPDTGKIVSVRLVDQAGQASVIDLVLWSADPSGTTFTDNAALDVADTDMVALIGVVPIAAADYDTFADNRVATVPNYNLVYGPLAKGQNGGYSMYGALVSRGTPTYAAATDLILSIGIEY